MLTPTTTREKETTMDTATTPAPYDPTPLALDTVRKFVRAVERQKRKIARGEFAPPPSKARKGHAYDAAARIARHHGRIRPSTYDELQALATGGPTALAAEPAEAIAARHLEHRNRTLHTLAAKDRAAGITEAEFLAAARVAYRSHA